MENRIVIPGPLLAAIELAWAEFMASEDSGDVLSALLNRLPDDEHREVALATVERRTRILA